ncbi:MAG: phytoene dehydrogenase, partial [Planctomycetota bacterium]
LRLTVLANPQYWASLDLDRYAAEKQAWHEAALNAGRDFGVLPDVTGDLADRVLDTDVFTPNTITKFTGHPNGAVYGSATKLRDGLTGLSGLYIIGTDQGYLGIVGSMLSGVSIANRLLT